MKAPSFWYPESRRAGLRGWLLSPLGHLVYYLGHDRFYGKPGYQGRAPVICVGNATVGGAGKTPVCAFLGRAFAAACKRVCFVTRGYGGSLKGPVLVRPKTHTCDQVGDEALILASYGPVIVSRNRVEGANSAATSGAEVIICDDALQNHPSLHQDLSLLVVDSERGFGNGKLIPAGPLREPIYKALEKCHAVILTGDGDFEPPREVLSSGKPVYHALRAPVRHGGEIEGLDVIAFAGIAHPERFFKTVRDLGARIIRELPFDDHEPFSPRLLERLIKEAEAAEALLVTTEKDMARIPPEYRPYVTPIMIELCFSDEDKEGLLNLIERRTKVSLV